MSAEFYIYGKKAEFWINFGWYAGNEFKLFGINVFETVCDSVVLFDLQVAKFCISFGLWRT